MKKFIKILIAFLIAFTFAVTAVYALHNKRPAMNKHKGMKKGNKSVNCIYCHGTSSNPKIAKRAGQTPQKNRPMCKGSGCH